MNERNSKSQMTTETNDQHILWWIMEDGEVIDWEIEHPKDCPVEVQESHDADGKLAWRGEWHDCAVTYETSAAGWEPFEEIIFAKGDGEHRQRFTYTYRFYAPCYPDYEADAVFDVKPCPEEKDTTASTAPAST